ncbi:MAG TPA: DUF4160 domain-containing protein [Chitinophagales bacterium]
MPNVFIVDGFVFYFYSREHSPIHIHVEDADAAIKIELETEVILVENKGMKPKQVKKAMKIAEERKAEIIAKWNAYFGK